MIGQRVSHYEIISKIGESPAGVVYKARDTESARMVSILALDPAVSADPERRRRIQDAVAAVSAIHHANLAGLYEFTPADGRDFIVGELVEGQSLDAILRVERLHRRDLFAFARQIAAALQAVHAAGRVHGGLTGACVVLDAQRRIKVLDCGLARLLRIEGQELPPETACFCSPEQVEGEQLGERSDIFSFGAVLYYMTTRRRAFRRDSFEATLQAVLTDEPKPIDSLTRHAPKGIEKVIRQCLRKDPARRYRRVAEIDEALERLALVYESKAQPGVSTRSSLSEKLPWIFGGVAALAVACGAGFWLFNPSYKNTVPSSTQITLDTGFDADPTVSSSALQVAYASDRSGEGNLDIWIQPVASRNPVRLTNHPADDREPSLSPDGSQVAFRSERDGGGVYLTPASGGDAKLLARDGRRPRFSPDGKWIAYWTGLPDGASKVFVIPSDGGQPRPIAAEFAAAANPVWSSDSRSLLFLGRKAGQSSLSEADWWIAPLEPGAPQNTGGCRALRQHALLRAEACPEPADWKGKSVYFSLPADGGSNVWRAEMLPSRDIVAKPVEITSGPGIHAQPIATDEGKVLFSKQSLNVDIWSAPLRSNEGKLAGPWKKLTTDPAADTFPSLSANGSKMLFQSDRRGSPSAWLLDLNTRVETPVEFERKDLLWPRLAPDGSKLSFAEEIQGRYDRFVMPAGGGNPIPLCQNCGRGMDWSPDGKSALVEDVPSKGIVLVKPGSNAKTLLLQRPGSTLLAPRYSSDRKWIAFMAQAEPASSRIYLAALRGESSAAPWVEWLPLTRDNAWEAAPQWSPDGKLVYFISNRDGHRCLWARRVDDLKNASEPIAVNHFHDTRRSPANTALNGADLFVGADRVAIGLGELSGSLWMLTPGR